MTDSSSHSTAGNTQPAQSAATPSEEGGEPAIRLDGLHKEYDNLVAVNDLSLAIPRGEVFGFLGPNGAGKSTTIGMLLGQIRPMTGTAYIHGINVHKQPLAARQHVGALPERASLYANLTGRQTLEFFADVQDVAHDQINPLLHEVRLTEDADRRVGGYSKGMVQRLAIAQALLGDPDLLILDEPTAGLDPRGAKEVRDIIEEVNEEGRTVFFSSHIISEVERLCDTIAILNEGELVAHDILDAFDDLEETFLERTEERA
jgi:ABC-2 type transport system ATP-binding protein